MSREQPGQATVGRESLADLKRALELLEKAQGAPEDADAFDSGPTETPLLAHLVASIVNADRSVHALGRAMASNPAPTSPQLARSIQAETNAWKRIEAEFGLLASGEVAKLLGGSGTNRNFASEKRRAGKILGVARGNTYRYPGFQFDRRRGTVLGVIGRLIALAAENGWPHEDVVLWLSSPSAYFHEQDRPVDHLEEPDRLLAAARDQFEAAG